MGAAERQVALVVEGASSPSHLEMKSMIFIESLVGHDRHDGSKNLLLHEVHERATHGDLRVLHHRVIGEIADSGEVLVFDELGDVLLPRLPSSR